MTDGLVPDLAPDLAPDIPPHGRPSQESANRHRWYALGLLCTAAFGRRSARTAPRLPLAHPHR
jgi:hypothetical protein